MMMYLMSLGAGLLVGVIYCILGVRSPAPPYIALVGLLGILIGEQVFPIVKSKFQNHNEAQVSINKKIIKEEGDEKY
jgi:XapX domain-containing protein